MKILIQVFLVVIILLAALGLLLLIPTPFEMIEGTFVLGLILLPLSIALYVSLAGFLGVSTLNLITYIFRNNDEDEAEEDENDEEYINLKKNPNSKYSYQPHTKMRIKNLNTAIKRKDTFTTQPKTPKKRTQSLLLNTLLIGGWITAISFVIGFVVLYLFIFSVSTPNDKKTLKAPHTKYHVEDYNDSRIIFYN